MRKFRNFRDAISWCYWGMFYNVHVLRDRIPDKEYLDHFFYKKMGYRMDFENPVTYNEKLQWLKLHDHNPIYADFVDKNSAKRLVGEKIGFDHIIPTLGVYESFDEIDFNALPDKFILKCTHDSGSVVICRDKESFDRNMARRKLTKSLARNWYMLGREWPYKNIPRRIIAEKYLENSGSGEEVLTDYKFFCFDGEPKIVYVSKDKAREPHTDFFDMDFNHLPIRMQDKNSDVPPSKPDKFEEMKRYAAILSAGIPHVRVDFYVVDSVVYFGELTFYHSCGCAPVHPVEWSKALGDWIKLPKH